MAVLLGTQTFYVDLLHELDFQEDSPMVPFLLVQHHTYMNFEQRRSSKSRQRPRIPLGAANYPLFVMTNSDMIKEKVGPALKFQR